MPIDCNPSNWDKENIWPLPITTFINPSISLLDNEQRQEDNIFLENENSCMKLKISTKLETLKDEVEELSIKRGRFETLSNEEKGTEMGENLILDEETESMVNICCWWSQRRNTLKNVKVPPCQFINVPSKASRCLFPSVNEEPSNLEKSSKNARIVLGELFNYVLSPFKKYSDEDECEDLPTCSSISTLYNGKQLNKVLPV